MIVSNSKIARQVHRKMTITSVAAWWGALVATAVAVWDVVKWRKRGPRLKIQVRQPDNDDSEFEVELSNVGEIPALIEKVWLRVFTRRALIFLRSIDLKHCFTLSGNNGFPPLTLTASEPWAVNIVLHKRLPRLAVKAVKVRIEIHEAHRKKAYRIYPPADRFLKWFNKEANPAGSSALRSVETDQMSGRTS